MLFRFTAAGQSLYDSDPSAFQITRFVLTDAFNYTLPDPPTTLQGDTVYDRTETLAKEIPDPNTIRFSILLDNTVGDFDFGEVGMYSGATLVAVGVSPTLISKTEAAGAEDGNFITLNAFFTSNNSNSYGFLGLANSDSNLRLPQIDNVDYLTPPYDNEPNAYVVNGLTPEDTPEMAFADIYGRWNFSAKPQRFYEGEVTTATTTAVNIASAHGVTFGSAADYVLQWTSGRLRGYARRLNSIGSTFFGWVTPTTFAPEEGDTFIVVGPQSTEITIEGQADILFQNEGSALGSAGTVTSLDFVGAGVNATRASNAVTVTIPGSPSVQYQDEGSNLGTAGTVDTVNFIGTPVTAARTGNTINVTVAAAPAAHVPITFQEEGSNLGTAGTVTTMNFVGDGVTVARVSNTLTVTIEAGGGGEAVGSDGAIQINDGGTFDSNNGLRIGSYTWETEIFPTLLVGADVPLGQISFGQDTADSTDRPTIMRFGPGDQGVSIIARPSSITDGGTMVYEEIENEGGSIILQSGYSVHTDTGGGHTRGLGTYINMFPGANSGDDEYAQGGTFVLESGQAVILDNLDAQVRSAFGAKVEITAAFISDNENETAGSGLTIQAGKASLANDPLIDVLGARLEVLGALGNGLGGRAFLGAGDGSDPNNPIDVYRGAKLTLDPGDGSFVSHGGAYLEVGGITVYAMTVTDGHAFGINGQTLLYLVPPTTADSQPQPEVIITGSGIRISNPYTPSSSSAPGAYGQIGWDNDYIYVCIDNGNNPGPTPVWKRVPLETF